MTITLQHRVTGEGRGCRKHSFFLQVDRWETEGSLPGDKETASHLFSDKSPAAPQAGGSPQPPQPSAGISGPLVIELMPILSFIMAVCSENNRTIIAKANGLSKMTGEIGNIWAL